MLPGLSASATAKRLNQSLNVPREESGGKMKTTGDLRPDTTFGAGTFGATAKRRVLFQNVLKKSCPMV